MKITIQRKTLKVVSKKTKSVQRGRKKKELNKKNKINNLKFLLQ
jgi:hypothetical protein